MPYQAIHSRIDANAVVIAANTIGSTYTDIVRIPLFSEPLKARFVELFFRWSGLTGGDAASTFHVRPAFRWGNAGPATGVDVTADGDVYNHLRFTNDGQTAIAASADTALFTASAAPANGSKFYFPIWNGGAGSASGLILPGRFLAVRVKNPGVAYASSGQLILEALVY